MSSGLPELGRHRGTPGRGTLESWRSAGQDVAASLLFSVATCGALVAAGAAIVAQVGTIDTTLGR